jgi:hypothetical protein
VCTSPLGSCRGIRDRVSRPLRAHAQGRPRLLAPVRGKVVAASHRPSTRPGKLWKSDRESSQNTGTWELHSVDSHRYTKKWLRRADLARFFLPFYTPLWYEEDARCAEAEQVRLGKPKTRRGTASRGDPGNVVGRKSARCDDQGPRARIGGAGSNALPTSLSIVGPLVATPTFCRKACLG